MDAIIESIQVNGFNTVITVDAQTNEILAGNHRWQALHALGAKECPVVFVDRNTEDGDVRYLIGDNRIGQKAVMDEYALSKLITDLRATEVGLIGSGFTDDEADRLLLKVAELDDMPVDGHGFGPAPMDMWQVVITFSSEEDRDEAYREIETLYADKSADVRKANI